MRTNDLPRSNYIVLLAKVKAKAVCKPSISNLLRDMRSELKRRLTQTPYNFAPLADVHRANACLPKELMYIAWQVAVATEL